MGPTPVSRAGARSPMAEAWGNLNFEQRTAAVGALLLVVSTFGPFSFVEAAEVLVALGVLALLSARGRGKRFHLPFGDGVVVLAAGAWAAALITVRLFDRPLGQNLLALGCAAILALAGLRERAKWPRDDLPAEAETAPLRPSPRTAADRAETEPLAPPEFDPAGRPYAGGIACRKRKRKSGS